MNTITTFLHPLSLFSFFMIIELNGFLITAGLLFAIGFFGVLFRRNVLVIYMCLELMLNAVNLALVAFSRYNATFDGQSGFHMMDGNIFVFFIITVAAAEIAVGLGIIVALYQKRQTIMVNELTELRD
jgi:NADH-quinone oxidoreductase subunit K